MIFDLHCYWELIIKQILEHDVTETNVYLSLDDKIMPLSDSKLNHPVDKIPSLDPCPL